MLLPHDARHNIWFARILSLRISLLFYILCLEIKKVMSLLQTTFLNVSLHLYNDIRLVTPTPPIGTVSAVTL